MLYEHIKELIVSGSSFAMKEVGSIRRSISVDMTAIKE